MVFSSITFLFYFLPLVCLVYMAVPKDKKNIVLFISSLVFYAWGEPIYVLLMLFSTVFNWYSALGVEKHSNNSGTKKRIMIVSLAVNIAILFFFKYADFFISTVNSVTGLEIALLNLPLPIGISFYTFQTLSYVIDVYRGNVKAQKSYIKFGMYVSMFPQLIAGPIVRYSDIEKDLDTRTIKEDDVFDGIWLFVLGLCKKVLVANNIGVLWDYAYENMHSASTLTMWLGVIGYSLQIYYDFSGYSLMAIGLGKIFGFEFLQNFNFPYISKSITEFWRRWHISLGTWFKEYVYIPLGGSKKGAMRRYINIFIVWLLTGLWHGASFNFVMWGIYYCMLLIIEKSFLLKKLENHTVFAHIYTLIAVAFGWVLFACNNLGDVILYFKAMFGFNNSGFADGAFLYNLKSNIVILALSVVFSVPYLTQKTKMLIKTNKAKAICTVILFVICTAYLTDATYNPFLYFRF